MLFVKQAFSPFELHFLEVHASKSAGSAAEVGGFAAVTVEVVKRASFALLGHASIDKQRML